MNINEHQGFFSMFACLDYMHCHWKNCPHMAREIFMDKDRDFSIILEAMANKRLLFWHVFFGPPRSNNDLNVLDIYLLAQNHL